MACPGGSRKSVGRRTLTTWRFASLFVQFVQRKCTNNIKTRPSRLHNFGTRLRDLRVRPKNSKTNNRRTNVYALRFLRVTAARRADQEKLQCQLASLRQQMDSVVAQATTSRQQGYPDLGNERRKAAWYNKRFSRANRALEHINNRLGVTRFDLDNLRSEMANRVTERDQAVQDRDSLRDHLARLASGLPPSYLPSSAAATAGVIPMANKRLRSSSLSNIHKPPPTHCRSSSPSSSSSKP